MIFFTHGSPTKDTWHSCPTRICHSPTNLARRERGFPNQTLIPSLSLKDQLSAFAKQPSSSTIRKNPTSLSNHHHHQQRAANFCCIKQNTVNTKQRAADFCCPNPPTHERTLLPTPFFFFFEFEKRYLFIYL